MLERTSKKVKVTPYNGLGADLASSSQIRRGTHEE